MPLSKIQFRPGINKETTSYSNENGWFDSDLIRFRKGYPEKMGGWTKLSSSTILGVPRSLHTWAALDGAKYMGVGTESKFYIEEGGGYNDITPLRTTTALGTNPLSLTIDSTIIDLQYVYGYTQGTTMACQGDNFKIWNNVTERP